MNFKTNFGFLTNKQKIIFFDIKIILKFLNVLHNY